MYLFSFSSFLLLLLFHLFHFSVIFYMCQYSVAIFHIVYLLKTFSTLFFRWDVFFFCICSPCSCICVLIVSILYFFIISVLFDFGILWQRENLHSQLRLWRFFFFEAAEIQVQPSSNIAVQLCAYDVHFMCLCDFLFVLFFRAIYRLIYITYQYSIYLYAESALRLLFLHS